MMVPVKPTGAHTTQRAGTQKPHLHRAHSQPPTRAYPQYSMLLMVLSLASHTGSPVVGVKVGATRPPPPSELAAPAIAVPSRSAVTTAAGAAASATIMYMLALYCGNQEGGGGRGR